MLASNEELDEYRDLYSHLDQSKDGIITVEELKKGLALYSTNLNISDSDWDAILQKVDADGDGYLSFNEFVNATFDRQKLLKEETMR